MASDKTQTLANSIPQIYRLCFLLTGDAEKALAAFQNTMREVALLIARGELPNDRLWPFHEARQQALAATAGDLAPEPEPPEEAALATEAATQIAQLEPEQLASWIAAAPEPQRSVLACFYLSEFSHREMRRLLDLDSRELAKLIAPARRQLQAWLNLLTNAHPI